MTFGIRNTGILFLCLIVAGGCSRKKPPAPPEPSAAAASQPSAAPASSDDEAARRRAEEERLRAEAARTRALLEERVHFAYDRFDIDADARARLDAKLPALRQDPSIRLRIEGHADERGSVEYNLALGMRRAQTVSSYLSGFGVDAGRFETVSFGEEQPVADGHDEAAWAQNRRADFRVTAGAVLGR